MSKEHNDIGKLEEELSQKLQDITKLSAEEKKKINEEIKTLIPYYGDLTDKIENRRIRMHDFSVQLLIALIAALTFLLTYEHLKLETSILVWIYYSSIVVIVIFILACAIISVIFIWQSKLRYPFLQHEKFSNKWKWFYYGNPSITKININPFRKGVDDYEHYLKGMIYFVDNYTKETIDKELEDNLQQLFLLQVHNYYKNKFYLQLTRIWANAIKLVIMVLVILCIGLGYEYFKHSREQVSCKPLNSNVQKINGTAIIAKPKSD